MSVAVSYAGQWKPMKSAKALERRPPLVDSSFIMRWPLVEDTKTIDPVRCVSAGVRVLVQIAGRW